MGIGMLRRVFSLAWVAGPPLAAFLLDLGGFRFVYGMAAAMYELAVLVASSRASSPGRMIVLGFG
jgi:SET family sugar efflux transporter-like MFS transporter